MQLHVGHDPIVDVDAGESGRSLSLAPRFGYCVIDLPVLMLHRFRVICNEWRASPRGTECENRRHTGNGYSKKKSQCLHIGPRACPSDSESPAYCELA